MIHIKIKPLQDTDSISTHSFFWALIAILCVNFQYANAQTMNDNYDTYGGLKAIKAEATGYFYINETGGFHYLITPEGHGYRALGINHFRLKTTEDHDRAIRNIKDWGFNAGCYEGPRWMWKRYPYTQGMNLVPICEFKRGKDFAYKDVFDPEFLASLEADIRKIVEPQRENAMLIGYFWTDIPLWERKRDGKGWIAFYRQLPAESAGGKVWHAWKEEHPSARENDFLGVIAKQLYSHAYQYLRKYDQNHLLFGDRFHEKVDMPEEVVKEILPYVDALAVQPTIKEFDTAMYDAMYEKYGKPVYIADHVSSFATEEHPRTMGQTAKDPQTYVQYYERYMTTALNHPRVIGYNKCTYQDEMAPGGLLKQGILKRDGTAYETVDGIKAANLKALEQAYTALEQTYTQ
jgi:hypothetical protein